MVLIPKVSVETGGDQNEFRTEGCRDPFPTVFRSRFHPTKLRTTVCEKRDLKNRVTEHKRGKKDCNLLPGTGEN